MQKDKYEVLVCVNGRRIKEYTHQNRTFVEGRPHSEYSLKLKNNSGKRVLGIVSVDGVNVISGDPASGDGGGYIIDPYDSIEVKGFRKDEDTVGAFKFCPKSKSYAKEVGLKETNGVIGVRFIEEQQGLIFNLPPINMTRRYPKVNPFPKEDFPKWPNSSGDIYYGIGGQQPLFSNDSISSVSYQSSVEEPSLSVGTTWGKKIEDKVTTSTFSRSNTITEIELWYGTRKDLKKMGVPLRKKQKVSFPRAFGNFATPPKNWNG